jgi:hypothetical protein
VLLAWLMPGASWLKLARTTACVQAARTLVLVQS